MDDDKYNKLKSYIDNVIVKLDLPDLNKILIVLDDGDGNASIQFPNNTNDSINKLIKLNVKEEQKLFVSDLIYYVKAREFINTTYDFIFANIEGVHVVAPYDIKYVTPTLPTEGDVVTVNIPIENNNLKLIIETFYGTYEYSRIKLEFIVNE